MEISHSNKQSSEVTNRVVPKTKVQIGDHVYESNWAVANTRYDLLLGMPWHEAVEPTIDYERKIIKVNDIVLPKAEVGEQSSRMKAATDLASQCSA